MIAHAAALFFYDPARRMRRDASMTFMSNGVLIGYVWLSIAGALWIVSAVNGSLSDSAIHTLTLGFAAGMVFVHAPTVLIAVTKVKLKYHWLLYTHLLLLYAGLTVRVIGDMTGVLSVMRIGSYITAIACAVFVVSLIAGVVLAGLRPART